MKTKTTNSGIKVKASVKAGGFQFNHNAFGLRIKAGLKGGAMLPLRPNHSLRLLTLR